MAEEKKTYVILQETSDEEAESWYYFIRKEGNEEALEHLNRQLNKVDWVLEEDLSTFDLDLEHPVSEQTAKEMTQVELNVYFHRKFDGKLKKIDFNLSEKDKNHKKIKKVNSVIGCGKIDEYIDLEDVEPGDDEEGSDKDNSNEEGSDEDEEESTTSSLTSNSDKKNEERPKGVPKALLNSTLPRFAKAKQHKKK